ncbi:MAG: chromate efflux transporter [SAR324 cluster bacterium]|nr:chromate efflux transporter [SAR324 cluster bacterium]
MTRDRPTLATLLRVFIRLGLTSFGGPVAHLGYFREEFVVRRRWLDEARYADLVALCQFLPGPASSQVGMGIGALCRGPAGALAAWLGFTLPSAAALVALAYGLEAFAGAVPPGVLEGLKVVAVAVVAQAVWGMGRSLCPDRGRATLALLAAAGVVAWPGTGGQIAAIILGALAGWRLLPGEAAPAEQVAAVGQSHRHLPLVFLAGFFVLLGVLPLIAWQVGGLELVLLDKFYRAGALVFGGGHVVLPLLEAEVVPPGLVGREAFLAGYGAAQAVPGPLFTFAAYLGAMIGVGAGRPPWLIGLLCLGAVFLPSGLLILGVLPYWDALRRQPQMQAALRGVNAAVVGLLLAALYDPVWTSAIRTPAHFALTLGAFGLLAFWKVPPWLVVLLSAVAGGLLRLN